MNKYRMDGMILTAHSPEDLVRQMHQTSFAPAEDDFAWMEQVAKRTFQSTGSTVRWGSAREFVSDMINAGQLTEDKP